MEAAFQKSPEPRKQVIVVAGSCGSLKSTVAKNLSMAPKAPFAENDELHSFSGVDRMAKGIPFGDDDRAPWLDRLGKRTLETINHLDYQKVTVSRLVLKRS